VRVIERGDDRLVGQPLEIKHREWHRAGPRQRRFHSRLDLVVVAVPARIVALAEEPAILLIAERVDVQAVGRGEVEALAQDNGGGG
ncbi:unnamed protein product, partial [Durusdinium trenchii]